jgi:hypothetical protein
MELADSKEYKKTMEIEATNHEYEILHNIRDRYLRLSLTHQSDPLPALSGIVTRLQQHGAGEYLAGCGNKTYIAN